MANKWPNFSVNAMSERSFPCKEQSEQSKQNVFKINNKFQEFTMLNRPLVNP